MSTESIASNVSKDATPLPKSTMAVLCIIICSEPMSLTILFPFVYFMVKDFHLSADERDIGYYVGLIASSFSFAQCLTTVFWGKLSDMYGRKPILLIGLLGNTITMLLFGVSHSLFWAILSRCACGILNGNVAVAKTVLSEITDHTNRAQGFAIFGFLWGFGMILGPVLGGFLASPATQYPSVFGSIDFLAENPYFLPCALSALISLNGFVMGLYFLPETNYKIINKKKRILTEFEQEDLDSNADEQVISYMTNGSTSESDMGHSIATYVADKEDSSEEFRKSLTLNRVNSNYYIPESVVDFPIDDEPDEASPLIGKVKEVSFGNTAYQCIIGYASIAFFNIILDEVFPIWASTSPEMGGLGFTSYNIGVALSLTGITQLFSQTYMCTVLKSRNAVYFFRLSVLLSAFVYPMYPIINIIKLYGPEWLAWTLLLLTMGFRQFLSVFAFTSISVLITNAAPVEIMGSVQATGQMCGSFMRGIGPALGGIMYAWSLQSHLYFPLNQMFVFVFLSIIALGTALHAYMYIPKSLQQVR